MPRQFYETIRVATEKFLKEGKFEAPSQASPYVGFDWQEFLSQKMLLTYAYLEEGSKESEVHFCPNGTFKAHVRKKGLFQNQNPMYKGKLTGTWSTKGVGETTELTLEFAGKTKLPPLAITLTIRDEQVFANTERYFVARSTECKAR